MIIEHSPNKKIKVTLSEVCYKRLNQDLFLFNIKLSQLIEAVIVSYCKDSEKITYLEDKKDNEHAIRFLLSSNDIYFKKTLITLQWRKTNSSARRFFEGNTKQFTWSLTKSACEALKNDSRSDSESTVFISELLEDFSTMPFAHKERIIFAKAISDIEYAIEKHKPFEYVSGGGFPIVMHPYKIVTDPNLQYTYVLGHGVPVKFYDYEKYKPSAENIRNIRLFNLNYDKNYGWIKLRYKEEIKINESLILKKLEDISPGFISDKIYDITVEMNADGEKLYKSIIHNRPTYISKSDEYNNGFKTYTFRCTLFQAVIYFMNFENKAIITAPTEAVEKIKTRLCSTLEMYT